MVEDLADARLELVVAIRAQNAKYIADVEAEQAERRHTKLPKDIWIDEVLLNAIVAAERAENVRGGPQTRPPLEDSNNIVGREAIEGAEAAHEGNKKVADPPIAKAKKRWADQDEKEDEDLS